LNERISESGTDLGKQAFELKFLGRGKPIEDKEKVSVAVKCSRFNV
jgi:hypothetical protein